MSSDSCEEECAKYESQAEKALQDLKGCRDQRRKLAEEMRGLSKRIKQLTIEIPKLTMEIKSFGTSREELQKRLPELKSQCSLSASDSEKLTLLKERVEKCKADMSSCASLAKKMELDVERLQQAILDAGGERLKRQQKVCQKIVNDLNDLTKKLNSSKVQLTSSQKAAEKASKAKEAFASDLEKSLSTLQEKKEDFKKLEAEAFSVKEAYDKVQSIENEKKLALQVESTECEALKKSQAKIKCIELEIKSKLDNCEKSLEDNQRRIDHWENQMSALREEEEKVDDESDDESDDDDDDQSTENDKESGDMGNEEGQGEDEEMNEEDNSNEEKYDHLPVFQENALRQYDKNEVKQDIAMLQKERDVIAKNANMQAIHEYKKKENDYLAR